MIVDIYFPIVYNPIVILQALKNKVIGVNKLNIMKNKKTWIILIVIALVSYTFGTMLQYRHDTYQGKTAQDWASLANKNASDSSQLKKQLDIANNQINLLVTAPTP